MAGTKKARKAPKKIARPRAKKARRPPGKLRLSMMVGSYESVRALKARS